MPRTLTRFRPVVLCEIEEWHTRKYGHGAADVLDLFLEQGYRAFVGGDGRLVEATRIATEHNDYLLLPAERV